MVYKKGCEIVDPHFPESEVLPFDITPKEQQMMDEAIEAAKSAEVVIMVLGGRGYWVQDVTMSWTSPCIGRITES